MIMGKVVRLATATKMITAKMRTTRAIQKITDGEKCRNTDRNKYKMEGVGHPVWKPGNTKDMENIQLTWEVTEDMSDDIQLTWGSAKLKRTENKSGK